MNQRRPFDRRVLTPITRAGSVKTTFDWPYHICLTDGGAEFGDWIDANSRNNGFDAGDLIECPVYVIEDVLRRALHQTDETIEFTTFDTHGNTTNGTIKDWKFQGSLYQIENSKDILQRLCMQCKSRLFRDADGLFSIWTYSTGAAVSYSTYKFDKTSTINNLSISRSPRRDVCNTVRINYALDRATGKYQKQTFISVVKKYSGTDIAEDVDATEFAIDVGDGAKFSNDDYILLGNELLRVSSISSNTVTLYNGSGSRTLYQSSVATTHSSGAPIYILTTNSDDGTGSRDQNTADPDDRELEAMESVWRYGITNEFTIDCDFIADNTTAQALREHYFDYLKGPKYIIEFDTFLNASDLVVNDVIEFDDSIMDSYLKLGGTSWSGQKFVVLNVERQGQMDYHVVAEHLSYSFI